MNIFYVHPNPTICAQQHVDKHVVKMILEYAQLMSTAHRVLDGTETIGTSNSGRKAKRWNLTDDRDAVIYKASHINHPSAKWTRHTSGNYEYLFKLWIELMREYHYRYGKIHSSMRLAKFLKNPPKNIPVGEFSPPWRAMPEQYKFARTEEDYTLKSYRAYILNEKSQMLKWKNRETPDWVH